MHAGPQGIEARAGTEICTLEAMLAVEQSHQTERVSSGHTVPPPGRTGAGHVTRARVPRAHADAASPHSEPCAHWLQRRERGLSSGTKSTGSPRCLLQLRTATVPNARQLWATLGSLRQVTSPPGSVVSSVEWEGNRGLPKAFGRIERVNRIKKYSACHKHAP